MPVRIRNKTIKDIQKYIWPREGKFSQDVIDGFLDDDEFLSDFPLIVERFGRYCATSLTIF